MPVLLVSRRFLADLPSSGALTIPENTFQSVKQLKIVRCHMQNVEIQDGACPVGTILEMSSCRQCETLTLGKDGSVTKGVATAAELGKLSRYVDKLLERVARELRSGNIDADPWSRGENESACTYCAFASACHFQEEGERDRAQPLRPVRPEAFWRYVDKTIGEEERS